MQNKMIEKVRCGDYESVVKLFLKLKVAGRVLDNDKYVAAYSYFMLGKYDIANKILDSMSKQNIKSVDVLLLRSKLYFAENDINTALSILDKLSGLYEIESIRIEQKNDFHRLISYYRVNEYNLIINKYKNIAKWLGFNDYDSCNNIVLEEADVSDLCKKAFWYYIEEKYDEAIILLNKALELDGANDKIRKNIVCTYIAKNDVEKAKSILMGMEIPDFSLWSMIEKVEKI